jgi:hypothetical protein
VNRNFTRANIPVLPTGSFYARFQASAAKQMRTALFLVVTRCVMTQKRTVTRPLLLHEQKINDHFRCDKIMVFSGLTTTVKIKTYIRGTSCRGKYVQLLCTSTVGTMSMTATVIFEINSWNFKRLPLCFGIANAGRSGNCNRLKGNGISNAINGFLGINTFSLAKPVHPATKIQMIKQNTHTKYIRATHFTVLREIHEGPTTVVTTEPSTLAGQ